MNRILRRDFGLLDPLLIELITFYQGYGLGSAWANFVLVASGMVNSAHCLTMNPAPDGPKLYLLAQTIPRARP